MVQDTTYGVRMKVGMMWRALRIGLPAGATCVIASLVSNALYDPYLDGWHFGRSFILEAEEKDTLSECSDFWLVLSVMVLWWILSLAATPQRRRRVKAWLLKLVSDQEHPSAMPRSLPRCSVALAVPVPAARRSLGWP